MRAHLGVIPRVTHQATSSDELKVIPKYIGTSQTELLTTVRFQSIKLLKIHPGNWNLFGLMFRRVQASGHTLQLTQQRGRHNNKSS